MRGVQLNVTTYRYTITIPTNYTTSPLNHYTRQGNKLMTITYSIWQGSRLLSIDNIAHEIKAVDHLIASLNESDLGKKVKFSANIMSIKVGE
jgi:hypothetical protein